MINVDEVFKTVKDLASKDKAGYVSTGEFNRMSLIAENILWDYYTLLHEKNSSIAESMRPFIAEKALPLSNGKATIPGDYGHRLNFWFNQATNGACGDGPSFSRLAAKYLERSELSGTLQSSIRRPSLLKGNIYWTYAANGVVQFYPTNIKPSVILEYLRFPVYAVRVVTLDSANDEEVYSSGSSKNYEWLENDRSNIIDLILFQVGMETKQSDLITYAAQRNIAAKTIIQ